jgi:ubiquinone/menaquinone biosynthesis C-methylase UbiE
MPDPTLKTYNKIYADYAKRNKLNPGLVSLLDKFSSYFPETSGKKVLDAGCAQGRDVGYFLKKGFRVTGIDLCLPFLDLARKEYPQAEFLEMDLSKLTFPDNSFAGLWASASFLHISKAQAPGTLSGFLRVLKPGGIAMISVMSGNFEGLWANTEINWPERYFSYYQKEELSQILIKAGFTILDVAVNPTNTRKEVKWLCFYCCKSS